MISRLLPRRHRKTSCSDRGPPTEPGDCCMVREPRRANAAMLMPAPPPRKSGIASGWRVLAGVPADRPDRAVGDIHRARLQLGRHRVVPPVVVAEEGDGGNDLDD